MPKADKVQAVEELTEKLAASNVAVIADYRGLTVAGMSELRRRLRGVGAEVHVTKNTLTRFAADRAGIAGLEGLLVGPTAIAFGKDNPGPMAKAILDYATESRIMAVRGGVLGHKPISAADVATLATLPPREVLAARALGSVQAPVAAFLAIFNGALYTMLGVMRARAEQQQPGATEGEGATVNREDLIKELEAMTVLDLVGLTKDLEQRWGVTAAAPVAAAAPAAGGAPAAAVAAPEEEEQTEFTVTLKEIGPNKVNVIKTVREFTTLGLKEAKDLVEAAPKAVKEGATKQEAQDIKAKLEAAGATADIS